MNNRKNEKTDGSSQGTASKRGKDIDSYRSGGQRGFESQGKGTGIQGSQCDDSGFSERRDRSECDDKPINANLGEVLEHLGNLETRFYNYVHAHQERLDLRRKESTFAEQEFQEEVKELREKILALLGEDNSQQTTETEESE